MLLEREYVSSLAWQGTRDCACMGTAVGLLVVTRQVLGGRLRSAGVVHGDHAFWRFLSLFFVFVVLLLWYGFDIALYYWLFCHAKHAKILFWHVSRDDGSDLYLRDHITAVKPEC